MMSVSAVIYILFALRWIIWKLEWAMSRSEISRRSGYGYGTNCLSRTCNCCVTQPGWVGYYCRAGIRILLGGCYTRWAGWLPDHGTARAKELRILPY